MYASYNLLLLIKTTCRWSLERPTAGHEDDLPLVIEETYRWSWDKDTACL